MAGVRVYLKRHYLKDPDSYEGISWEAFGIYNKDNNTWRLRGGRETFCIGF